MTSAHSLLAAIDDDTLKKLVQKSFSASDISVEDSKALAKAMLMQEKLTINIPAIKSNRKPTVFFTHDIDWIDPLHPVSIIKSFIHNKRWLRPHQLFDESIFISGIEKLISIEKHYGIDAIYMLGANSNRTTNSRYDIRYNTNNSIYRKLIGIINSLNVSVGLHSQIELNIEKQLTSLSKISKREIIHHRRHYLNFDPLTMWTYLDGVGIKYDYSVAQSTTVGFANGIPRDYLALDFIGSKLLNTHVVPTILCDNAFFKNDKRVILESFKITLDQAFVYGSKLAILFHPENMVVFPFLWDIYEEIIDICKQQGTDIY